MKAIIQTGYGSSEVLRLEEVEKPVPADEEVLVRVRAASVNAGDYFTMEGKPFVLRLTLGVRRPRVGIVGWDLAGRVEAVGGSVTGFALGDEVFGSCGLGRGGSFAEYARVPVGLLGWKPANLTFGQAAAVPTAAVTALRGVRDAGKLRAGQRVLINNASGGVGTFAVQIAKALGAEVTGVCGTSNAEMVRSIGADHVFDHTKEDFTESGLHYDLILDNVGTHPFSAYKRALTPQGRIVPNTGHAGLGYILKAFVMSACDRRVEKMFSGTPGTEDLVYLKELIESGKVTPVIDRTYALGETPAAMAYAAAGHVHGKVVITVDRPDTLDERS